MLGFQCSVSDLLTSVRSLRLRRYTSFLDLSFKNTQLGKAGEIQRRFRGPVCQTLPVLRYNF